jgi:hypothetical protein
LFLPTFIYWTGLDGTARLSDAQFRGALELDAEVYFVWYTFFCTLNLSIRQTASHSANMKR